MTSPTEADGLAALARAADDYVTALFAPHDPALEAALTDAAAAGLPSIHVSPAQGKLLHVLARLQGARTVLEIGTLGGYSTIWLARALPGDGRLVSLELSPGHAEVARGNLRRAGLDARVEIRVGPAGDSLQAMVEAGEGPFDLFFIDADKGGYPQYLEGCLRLARPGSLILADNVIRGGAVTQDAATGDAAALRAFNAEVAAHPRLVSVIVPVLRGDLDGLAISLVTEAG